MTDATAPSFEPTADLPEALPPTSNVVLKAAREIDITDRDAVAADVARSQTKSAFLVHTRQEHEIKIDRCNNELLRIEADMNAIRARADSRIATIRAEAEEDLAAEMAKARAVDTAKRAAQAAIQLLDGGA